MEHISIAVVTEDREYGRALSLAMLNVCRGLIMKILNQEEFFSQRRRFYAEQEKEGGKLRGTFCSQFDLILWDGGEGAELCGGNIVFLGDKPSLAAKDFAGRRFCLYKYSPGRSMVADLFEIYSHLTGRRAVNVRKQNVRLLAFASWRGGSGCTTLAMAVGRELCRFHGKRALYLSFEELESTGEFMESPPGVKGAGVYLYHLFKDRSPKDLSVRETGLQDHPFLEGFTVQDDFELEAFAPTAGRNPLKHLSSEELQVFLASLIDSGRYDVILLDLGCGLDETNLACAQMAERICIVGKTLRQDPREAQYLRHLICNCGEEALEKSLKVINRLSFLERPVENEKGEEQVFYIEQDGTVAARSSGQGVPLEGKFGQQVSGLTERMMEAV